jgi:hypothetical protein
LNSCSNYYKEEHTKNVNNSYEATKKLQNIEIIRAIVVYFSCDKDMVSLINLHKSWIEMINYEPKVWRTELIIFIDLNINERKRLT